MVSPVPGSFSNDRRGFTLIEVMAAVVIFSIVLTAVFATFTFQAQSYTTQSRVAEMQQNLRIALDTLQRDIRMAGYGISSDITVDPTGGTTTVAMRGFYSADGGEGAPDGIYILYTYDVDNTVAALAPTLTTGAWTAMNTPTTAVGVTPGTGSRFSVGDLVILSNSTSADLYQVTAKDNNNITFGNTKAINTNGHNAVPAHYYDTGSKVSRARFIRYYIDNTVAAHPTLMVSMVGGTASQPLSEDIEDLQFQYGVAATSSNPLVSSVVDNMSVTQLLLIRRVQLSIIARSEVFEKGWSGQRMNIGNRTGTAPADQYRRRVVDNVAIDLRNLRLN
jgi:type IV pilus assembly protein PilW